MSLASVGEGVHAGVAFLPGAVRRGGLNHHHPVRPGAFLRVGTRIFGAAAVVVALVLGHCPVFLHSSMSFWEPHHCMRGPHSPRVSAHAGAAAGAGVA